MRFARFLALWLLVAVARPTLAASPDDIPLAPAVECTPRSGLPNFLAKLAAGQEVRIGYLGGSITAQEGWRPKALAYFQKNWPTAKLSQINAAIGGTGSDLGVFRVKQDVLEKKPDLLFVEFAVNDGGAAPQQIYRCMEGIVRQTWRALPECDICFVYTLTKELSPPMLEGKFPRAASAMEKVAEHYGIPSIHMAMEVAKLAKADKLIWNAPLPKTDEEKQAVGDKLVFAPDTVHPHPQTGHELYLQAIVRSMESIKTASTKPGAHALPAPFVADNYENAKLVSISEATLTPRFALLDRKQDGLGKQFAERMPALYRGTQAGDTITFKFQGTTCSIYDVIGPDSGQVSVTVDDQPAKLVSRFDSYCKYWRLSRLTIGNDLPDAVHTVKIEISPIAPDKVKIFAQRNETMDKPERFEGTAFYPGAILLVGDLVK